MIGVYDYTVILTYLSAISAGLGMLASLAGNGHPFIGAVFLLFCGLFDAFDGKVARTKKNRTEYEKKFGIQIDSLTDILAFGFLPMAIATALIRINPVCTELFASQKGGLSGTCCLYAVMLFYLIAALARLAHYNVTEEERQVSDPAVRKYYEGVPVTSASLVFPTILLIRYLSGKDCTVLFILIMLVMGFAFVSRLKIPKPGTKGILVMVCIGFLEVVLLIAAMYFKGTAG